MKVIKQIWRTPKNIISIQKIGKIFLLFTSNGIYVWGNEKEIDKFIKDEKVK